MELELIDPNASDDANLQHCIHFIEGYRSQILALIDEDIDTEPYSRGSARDISFKLGIETAKKDLTTIP